MNIVAWKDVLWIMEICIENDFGYCCYQTGVLMDKSELFNILSKKLIPKIYCHKIINIIRSKYPQLNHTTKEFVFQKDVDRINFKTRITPLESLVLYELGTRIFEARIAYYPESDEIVIVGLYWNGSTLLRC